MGWRDRNGYLLLAAGVTGFWSDCAHADTWLKGQEQEENENDDKIDAKAALMELDAFESNILAPWNEKFKLLQKLTKYEEEFKTKENEAIEAEKLRVQKEEEQERLRQQERELMEKRKIEKEIEEWENEERRVMEEKLRKEEEQAKSSSFAEKPTEKIENANDSVPSIKQRA